LPENYLTKPLKNLKNSFLIRLNSLPYLFIAAKSSPLEAYSFRISLVQITASK